jgi:hypothetical protein
MKDYNNLFGKSYSTRPGGSLSDKCPHDITKFNNPSRTPRDLTEQHRIRRPGSVVQPPSVHVIDFDMMKANDILKYGTKVHIDDSQAQHTFTDENGNPQTKKLAELSFDVSTKLSELQKITALGSNVPLDDKMNILNTMIQEISGKFDVLSGLDMKNISQIIKYMGDEMKRASDLQLPDFLTQNGYANEVLDNEARLTLWLAKQSTTYGYMATHGLAKTKLTTNEELSKFIKSDPRVLYNLNTLEITLPDWGKLDVIMKMPKNSGKLIDGFEYDAHPQTNALNAAKAQRVADEVTRIEKKQQEQKDRENKEQEKKEKKEQEQKEKKEKKEKKEQEKKEQKKKKEQEKKEQKEQKEEQKQEDKRQRELKEQEDERQRELKEQEDEKERMLKAFNDRMLENIIKGIERKERSVEKIKRKPPRRKK